MSDKSGSDFRTELEHLINRFSKENGSNTADFILADYLVSCLSNLDLTIQAREAWYGRTMMATQLSKKGE